MRDDERRLVAYLDDFEDKAMGHVNAGVQIQLAKLGVDLHGVPERITIDKSGANAAAIQSLRVDSGVDIELRQSKYLNNIVEQDHRAIKRIARPMLGFKTFGCARAVIAGIEPMHTIKKGQFGCPGGQAPSAADQFNLLAF